MACARAVHLVDHDKAACREWLRILAPAGYEVRSFACAADFLEMGLAERPHCVVAEFALPDVGGLELQERMRGRGGAVPIVFASKSALIRNVVRAMKAGAVDFLQKPVRASVLVDAVARAVKMAEDVRADESSRSRASELFSRLTPRERVIFAHVLQGRLNKQIAATLDCREATVKVHRSRLMRKLEVRSVARLVHIGQTLRIDRVLPELAAAIPPAEAGCAPQA